MSRFSLIISIVPHDKGEKVTKAAVEAGSGGGTVLMGRELAKSNFGAVLGLGETTKDLIYMVVESEKKVEIGFSVGVGATGALGIAAVICSL